MPNRIIKESIWTSPNLNQLSDLAERHFYRILVLPDDFGCCELSALVVKGRCYPLRPDITVESIDVWQQELEDQGLITRWNEGGRQYAIFPSFSKHQRIRSLHQRKTPVPPDEALTRVDGNCRQVATNDRLNPNPNPNPNPLEDGNNNGKSRKLYSILESTKGFPAYSMANAYKLDEVMADYNGLNYHLEFKKFREYWTSRNLKRPWLALRNWLGRTQEGNAKDKRRRLPTKYTPTGDYPDL